MAPVTIGDLQNNLRKLEKVLRAIRYGGEIDFAGLARGAVSAYIPIYEYLFTSYHRAFSERLCSDGIELSGKVDYAFVKAVYKALRDMFAYKPPITVDQFFSDGFVERKAIMTVEVIDIVCNHYAPPTTQRSMQAKASKEMQSTADAKKSARDTASCARGSSSVTAATGRPLDERPRVPRVRSAISSAVPVDVENGPNDDTGPIARNFSRRLQLASQSTRLQESSDADVLANFRVKREHIPAVYRVPLGDVNDAGATASDKIFHDDPHPAIRWTSGQTVAAATTTAVAVDHPMQASSTAAAVHYDGLAQVATALAKSMESVNQRLQAMEARLDALSSIVASSTAAPPEASAATAAAAAREAPATENLVARVALLESRLATLSSTVASRLSAVESKGVRDTTQLTQLSQAAATATAAHHADAARGRCIPEHPAADLVRDTSAEGNDSGFLVPGAAGGSSSSISYGTVEGGGSYSPGDGALGSPGLFAEPSFGGGDSMPTGDCLPAAAAARGPCCLSTPDRAQVNKISQMLEGTMKMLRGK